jgi:hypothetical protein
MNDSEDPLAPLRGLHEEVDRQAADLAGRHEARLNCRRGCHDCCVDEITVFEVEAERIRRRHARLLSEGKPSPVGACAFLDGEGACRTYEDRPYVCRTQGLPLRWTDERDGFPIELRDICPLNDLPAEPLEELPEDDCWTLGPYEGRLAQLQVGRSGAPPRRVRLRDLW